MRRGVSDKQLGGGLVAFQGCGKGVVTRPSRGAGLVFRRCREIVFSAPPILRPLLFLRVLRP